MDWGEFDVKMDVEGGYKELVRGFGGLEKELGDEVRKDDIEEVKIGRELGLGDVYVRRGKENLIWGLMG